MSWSCASVSTPTLLKYTHFIKPVSVDSTNNATRVEVTSASVSTNKWEKSDIFVIFQDEKFIESEGECSLYVIINQLI